MKDSVLFKQDAYRVMPICSISEEGFQTHGVKDGLAVERECGKSENGEPSYYVLTFVRWDREKVVYDPLLDRIVDQWWGHPEEVAPFKAALEYAKNKVEKANKE